MHGAAHWYGKLYHTVPVFYHRKNVAARLMCKAEKSDHIHPILQTLHRYLKQMLDILYWMWIQYKISSICFSFISVTSSQCLSDLPQPYTAARQLQSTSDAWTFITIHVSKNIWWKIIFLCWPICLEQVASNSSPLILPPLLKPPSRCTCAVTISKLSFSQSPHSLKQFIPSGLHDGVNKMHSTFPVWWSYDNIFIFLFV